MSHRCSGLAVMTALLLAQNAIGAQSRSASDAERVWARYMAALGGQAWQGVKTREVRGTVEYRATQQQGIADFAMFWKAPRSVAFEMRHPMGPVTRGFDGSRAWGTHPQTGTRQISAQEIDEMLLDAVLYQPLGVRQCMERLPTRGT